MTISCAIVHTSKKSFIPALLGPLKLPHVQISLISVYTEQLKSALYVFSLASQTLGILFAFTSKTKWRSRGMRNVAGRIYLRALCSEQDFPIMPTGLARRGKHWQQRGSVCQLCKMKTKKGEQHERRR